MSDPIAILEAAYTLGGGEQEWLEGVARAANSALELGGGIFATTYDVKEPDRIRLRATAICGDFDRSLLDAASRVSLTASDEHFVVPLFRRAFIGTFRRYPEVLKRAGATEERVRRLEQLLDDLLRSRGLLEEFWINAQDPTHFGSCLIAPSASRRQWQPREAQRWLCIATHIAAAFRFRRQLEALPAAVPPTDASSVEAILSPDGSMEHAKNAAQEGAARHVLRDAVVAMDRARGPARRTDPAKAVLVWQALVAGRWSLVDHFDSDGRRYVVAHRNNPEVPDLRGLTLREQQVVAHAALGHSNKMIGYELGLSLSTVATHLTSAREKLRLSSYDIAPLRRRAAARDGGP